MDCFSLRFWGVRGSVPTAGTEFVLVGGNTSCVEVRVDDEILILDAGTGALRLGESFREPVRATFLFSHFHWDHIQGFPVFRPVFVAGNAFTLYGPGSNGSELLQTFARQMQPPYFPVPLESLPAHLEFRPIRLDEPIQIGRAHVRAAALNHPQGCFGYRISVNGTSVAYVSDTEPLESGAVDPAVVELARGASLLIYDSQYTDEEYAGRSGPCRKGWGHSTVTDACRVARAADVQQLALFHHDPSHTDRMVDRMVSQARLLFPSTISAREGVTLTLTQQAWPDQIPDRMAAPALAQEPFGLTE
jgi:phosphoribosyl 1,2-cyclic phosphodiesterase